jgi:hypothetical protein
MFPGSIIERYAENIPPQALTIHENSAVGYKTMVEV